MRYKILVLLILLVGILNGGGFFSEYRWGCRGSVLGAGYVGIADDASGFIWNAGSLGQMGSVEVVGLYGVPYSVVDFGMMMGSVVYPLGEGRGVIGGGIMQYSYGGLANEGVYIVGYGRKLEGNDLYIGGNLKVLSLRILADIDDEVYNTNKMALSADVGGLYYINESISLGGSVRNLLPADITLGKGSSEKEVVGMELMGGVGYKSKIERGWLVLSGGVISSYDGINFDLGGEYWMVLGGGGMVGLRAGYVGGNIGLGGSYKQDKFKVELSYIISNTIKNSSGFNIGISYVVK